MASTASSTLANTPFAALDECHRQIAVHLTRLDELLAHLDRHGIDEHARGEARAIEAFFSETSRGHHHDEEVKVFPALLASSDEQLVATVRMLQQDHGWIEEDWIVIAPQLRSIAAGYSWHDPAELQHAVQIFLELCREHIQLEESIIYPEARRLSVALPRRRATRPATRFTAAAPSSS
jgi:hemerythrin-like domain-containing protein